MQQIVDELPAEDGLATPTTSRSPTRGAVFVLILPAEVEQLLSTLAR